MHLSRHCVYSPESAVASTQNIGIPVCAVCICGASMPRTMFAFPIDGVAIWTARISDDCASETHATNSEVLIASSSSGIDRLLLLEFTAAIQYCQNNFDVV